MTVTIPIRKMSGVALAAWAGLLLALTPASAGVDEALGPNSDFPDSNLVMPFAGGDGSPRVGFFTISNLGLSGPNETPVPVTWSFYDENGALLEAVQRHILGEGGTDLVDITSVRSRAADGTEGPPSDLSGRNGFVVVSKDDGQPDLIGNWTSANISSNAGFGGNAGGLGFVGLLPTNGFVFGTTFAPTTLEDSVLMILGVDDFGPVPTSLTDGAAAGGTVFEVEISLHSNTAPGGEVGRVIVPVQGTALFTTLQEIFPGFDLSSSMTMVASAVTDGVSIMGFYGQAVGQFGAGQSLRADLPLASAAASAPAP